MSRRMRIGMGVDVHRLVPGRPLTLGGVHIPSEVGLLGHSDADVLVHAVMDALLGAARAGDIGALFPDDDPSYEGADSLELLGEVARLIESEGLRVVDVDCVLMLEQPKVSGYRDEMREAIATALDIDVDSVGVKATTTEGLGAVGRGEGVQAHAVVILEGPAG